MVENDKQLAITKKQIAKFKQTLFNLNIVEYEVIPMLVKAQSDSLQSMIDQLEEEVTEYETKLK